MTERETGREDKRENDLFFVCAVIEVIGRKTKNRRGDVVQALGENEIARLLDLADVLHCEPVENTAAELIAQHAIAGGGFDNVALCKYNVPTHFDIAKVYKRLIAAVAESQRITFAAALRDIYSSWISDAISDYNSSMYFENPQYLLESFRAGEALKDY
jgi:hypothetical protein